MDIAQPLPLPGGLSPQRFMKRHWQKKPLLMRGPWSESGPLLTRGELFALAGCGAAALAPIENGWQAGWLHAVENRP